MPTYQGSCHCKKVRFEVDVDFTTATTTRCNCTSCWKRRWWGVAVKPDKFRLLAGADELHMWKPSSRPGGFCRHCGIGTFGFTEKAEWNDGDYWAVNIAALDGVDPAVLASARILYLDGLHDTWAPIEDPPRYL